MGIGIIVQKSTIVILKMAAFGCQGCKYFPKRAGQEHFNPDHVPVSCRARFMRPPASGHTGKTTVRITGYCIVCKINCNIIYAKFHGYS